MCSSLTLLPSALSSKVAKHFGFNTFWLSVWPRDAMVSFRGRGARGATSACPGQRFDVGDGDTAVAFQQSLEVREPDGFSGRWLIIVDKSWAVAWLIVLYIFKC